MGAFEEMGRKLDELAQKVKIATQEGVGRTGKGAKDWGKKLDELGGTIKKMTREGIEKFASQTKNFTQITKLNSQIRDIQKKKEHKITKLGNRFYESGLYKKLEDNELNEMVEEIVKLEKEIKIKEEEIQKMKK